MAEPWKFGGLCHDALLGLILTAVVGEIEYALIKKHLVYSLYTQYSIYFSTGVYILGPNSGCSKCP